MQKRLFTVLFLFITLFLSHSKSTFAACGMEWWYEESHSFLGCWEGHGCSSVSSSGYLDTDCGNPGIDRGRRERWVGTSCSCPGGNAGVSNNMVILHNRTGDTRYSKNTCSGGLTGVDVVAAENATGRSWKCESQYGGHLQFTSLPGEDVVFDVSVVPGITTCNWQVDSGGPSGSDSTTDGICTVRYEMGSDSWTDGVVVYMNQPPDAPPPTDPPASEPLPCPTLNPAQCLTGGTQVRLSWTAVPGAYRYGVYANKTPYGDWVGPGDIWSWPLTSTTTSNTYTITPNVTYSWNAQATKLGETGNGSVCAPNSQTFQCTSGTPPNTCPGQCIAGACGAPYVCDTTRNMCVHTSCVGQSCTCTPGAPQPYCGDGITQDPNGFGYPEKCDEGNTTPAGNNNADQCDTLGTTPHTRGECTQTFCGDGVVQAPNGDPDDGVVNEQCDGGPTGSSTCTDQCTFPRVTIAGDAYVAATATDNGNNCVGGTGTDAAFNAAAYGKLVTIERQLPSIKTLDVPPSNNTKTTPFEDDASFSTTVYKENSLISVTAPTIPGYTLLCPADGTLENVSRNADATTLKFFYESDTPTVTEPWWQAKGGLLYSYSNLASLIPETCLSAGGCDPYMIYKGSTNSLSAGIPMSGGITDFGTIDANKAAERPNAPGDRNQKAHDTDHTFALETYDTFAKKFDLDGNGTTVSNNLSNGVPTCAANSDGVKICKVSGNTTISTDDASSIWNITSNTKIIVFVENGNLTFEDNNLSSDVITNVATGSFLAFIVDGNIIFDDSVGNGTASSETPNVEGVFLANNININADGNAATSDKRFVGEGTFVASSNITLNRDFTDGGSGTNNHATIPTELFIYRPDFLLNVPEIMKNYTLEWQEVN